MASVFEERVESPAASDDSFSYPEDVLVDGEPSVPDPVHPEPDPNYLTSKQLKEEEKEEGRKQSGGEVGHNLKSTLIISGAVVAFIGAIFAIVKKIREP